MAIAFRKPKVELKPNRHYLISYRTRDLTGHGDHEEDTIYARWTGEIDTWGKLTIRVPNGPTHYLFRDEIIDAELA